jgi:menaquinone-dependent protoporphyrinogen oxidase
MHILVAYGSKRGGTAGLATMIGDALTDAGCDVTVARAALVTDLDGVDAVVVAGSLYANRWHRDARRFVRRHAEALRRMPVWLVSSGPLDDSAAKHSIPATKQVAELGRLVHARGHVTLGGRLAADAKGFPAQMMAKKRAGDWRNPDHVRAFAAVIVRDMPSREADRVPVAD